MNISISRNIEKISILFLISFSILIITKFNFQQYGGMDCGVLSQLSWRLYLGQNPYTEIPCALPPLFIIPLKFVYKIFGINNAAFIYLNYIISLLFFLLYSFLVNRATNELKISLFFSYLLIIATIQLFPYWWYNSSTTLILFGYILSVILFFKNPTSKVNIISKILLTSLLMISKINIAIPALVLIETSLLISIYYQKLNIYKYLKTIFFSILLLVIIITVFNINYLSYIENIKIQTGRLNFKNFYTFYYANEIRLGFILPECILYLFTILHFKNKKNKKIDLNDLLVVSMIIISFIGKITNNDFNINENIVPISIITIINFKSYKIKYLNISKICCFILLIYLFVLIARRDRIRAIGFDTFWKTKKDIKLMDNENDYFYGFYIPDRLINIQQELNKLKYENELSIFFGPRIDHGYSVIKIRELNSLPLWWEGINNKSNFTIKFKEANFKIICLLNENKNGKYKPDFTFLNLEMVNFIQNNYWIDSNYNELVVFKLK